MPKKIKDGLCVINLNEYTDVGTCLYALNKDITYFDSFGFKYVPKENQKFIGSKNIKTIIFRVQANNSVMCGYFCIGFIDFMLSGKSFQYTGFFLP